MLKLASAEPYDRQSRISVMDALAEIARSGCNNLLCLTNKTARRRRLKKHLNIMKLAVSLVLKSKGVHPDEKMMALK